MIITRGCTARYSEGLDPSTRINAWLKENPEAKLVDVKLVPTREHNRGDVYVMMILDVPDDLETEGL